LLSNITVRGGAHYVFDYSEQQLRVTNPRAKKKKEKAKKEKGGSEGGGRGKKRALGDGGEPESKPKQKRRKD